MILTYIFIIVFKNRYLCFCWFFVGNLVTNGPPPKIGDQIFQQLYQEASASTMQNYDKGQYPVIPPVSGAPHYMQYTSQGLSSMPQNQAPLQAPPPQVIIIIIIQCKYHNHNHNNRSYNNINHHHHHHSDTFNTCIIKIFIVVIIIIIKVIHVTC